MYLKNLNCLPEINVKTKTGGNRVVLVLVFVAESCPTLFESMNCSLLGSSVHGIVQARVLEWVMPFSRTSSRPRDRIQVYHMAGRFFTVCATREVPNRVVEWFLASLALNESILNHL